MSEELSAGARARARAQLPGCSILAPTPRGYQKRFDTRDRCASLDEVSSAGRQTSGDLRYMLGAVYSSHAHTRTTRVLADGIDELCAFYVKSYNARI